MIYTTTTHVYNELPDVSVVNSEYLFWFPYWQTIRDCMMGEIMVKARNTRYLPRTKNQTDAEYTAYLQRATFYNATSRTVAGLVGAVHSRAPIIDGVPPGMDLTNITSDGQSFDMMMKKITKEIIAMGRFGVMVDAPPQGGDPYLVGYSTEDIVDWATYRDGSRERLQYVVLREFSRSRAPFSNLRDDLNTTYRVLLIDDDGFYKQRIYQTPSLETGEYTEVIPVVQGNPLREIPFVVIGPYDFGFDVEKPPIIDIALLNLSHYRSYAQLEAGQFYTATPIYTTYLSGGGSEEAEFEIGPNVVWQLGADEKAEILEFTGAGLKYLENSILTKERQIAALGGKLSAQLQGTAAESTDAVIARERGEASFLGSVIATVSEAGSRLLTALADWRGTPSTVKVTYASDSTQIYLDGREIRAMAMLYDTGLLPLETIFSIFRQNQIIPAGVTFEEFKMMLPERAPKVQNKVIEAEEKAKIEDKYSDDSVTETPPEPPKQRQNRQNWR